MTKGSDKWVGIKKVKRAKYDSPALHRFQNFFPYVEYASYT